MAEEQLIILRRIDECISSLGPDVENNIRSILQSIKETTNASSAIYQRKDGVSWTIPEKAEKPSEQVNRIVFPVHTGSQVVGELCLLFPQTIESEEYIQPVGNIMACALGMEETRARWEEEIVSVERMAAMGRLAGAVAHEINNPLQSILLHLELIKESVADKNVEKNLSRIEDGVKRITDIISRILQLHHEGEEEEDVDLNDVVKGVCTLIERQLERVGGICEFHLRDNIPRIRGVRQLLHQAVLNVVLNALESLNKGGKIILSTRLADDTVEVEVRDNGVGIDKRDLPHVFEPFYSSKGGARPGLGLFISHAVVIDQGGRINVASKLGKGTAVHMYFPATR